MSYLVFMCLTLFRMSGSHWADKNTGLDMIKRRVVDPLMAVEYPCVIELSFSLSETHVLVGGFCPLLTIYNVRGFKCCWNSQF